MWTPAGSCQAGRQAGSVCALQPLCKGLLVQASLCCQPQNFLLFQPCTLNQQLVKSEESYEDLTFAMHYSIARSDQTLARICAIKFLSCTRPCSCHLRSAAVGIALA